MEIIIRVREMREKKGMSVRQLAMLSGVSKSQVSAIERGRSIPTILALCQLAEALHADPGELYDYVPDSQKRGEK